MRTSRDEVLEGIGLASAAAIRGSRILPQGPRGNAYVVPRMARRGRVLVGSVTMNLFMPSASRWGAVLVVAALVACKTPKVGDPCASTGDNRCTGTEAALLCIDGKLAAAT